MQPYLNRFSGSKRLAEPDPGDDELTAKRRKNDARHEYRWHSIIKRYSRDYSRVSDEIDLGTGRVVADNGHLRNMRGELDNGFHGSQTPSRHTRLLSVLLSDEQEQVVPPRQKEKSAGEADEDEEDDEAADGNEDDIDRDEEDGSEDELNSDWPEPPSASRRRDNATPQAHRREVVVRNVQQQMSRKSSSPTLLDEQAYSPHSEDRHPSQPTAASPPTHTEPLVFPHMQMPNIDLPSDMQGKMQALVPVFQAQMMAFMNIVMAPTTKTTTVASTTPVQNASSASESGSPTANNAPLRSNYTANARHKDLQSAQQTGRQEQLRRAIAGHYNISSDIPGMSDSYHREGTPGRGSLWALQEGPRSQHRSRVDPPIQLPTKQATILGRQADESHAKQTEHGTPPNLHQSPARLGQNSAAERRASNVKRLQPPIVSPPRLSSARPVPKRPSTRANLPFAVRSQTITRSLPHDQERKSSSTPTIATPSPRDSPDFQFIADSEDEFTAGTDVDELNIATPKHDPVPYLIPTIPKRGRPRKLTTTNPVQGSKKKSMASLPASQQHAVVAQPSKPSPRPVATVQTPVGNNLDLSRESTEELQDHAAAPTKNLRFNLRARSKVITYNDQAAFSNLLDDPLLDEEDADPVLASSRHRLSAPEHTSISPEDSGLEIPPEHSGAGNVFLIDLTKSYPNSDFSTGAASNTEYTAFHQQHLATYSIDPKLGFVQYPDGKFKAYTFDERDTPHPCLHCKCTWATGWIPDPSGSSRFVCNACWAYMKKHDGKRRPASYQEYRESATVVQSPCDHCANISIRPRRPDEHGRRLCRLCKGYAKAHDGQLPSEHEVRKPKRGHVSCQRCSDTDSPTLILSNRSRVCRACHDDIFTKYDETSAIAPTRPILEEGEDMEMFFDHCLLIYAHQLLPELAPDVNNVGIPSPSARPCKACHKDLSSRWRRALNGVTICNVCYVHVSALIEKHNLYERLGSDGTGALKDIKTKDFTCGSCHEPIQTSKWRKASEDGEIVCTGCFEAAYSRVHPAK